MVKVGTYYAPTDPTDTTDSTDPNMQSVTRLVGEDEMPESPLPKRLAWWPRYTPTPGILYKDDFQEIGTETFYFRRDTKGGFRIVGWQYDEGQRKRWRDQWLEKRRR